MAALLLAGRAYMPAAAQTAVPASTDAWIATDSLRALTYLGRPPRFV